MASRSQAIFAPRQCCPRQERDLLSVGAEILLLMKKITLLGLCRPFRHLLGAQSAAPTDQKQLEALLKIVQEQQTQIAENQVKIDAKLATLAEAIRVAKIYSSRGGR